jgi:hypothetical protein
MCTKADLFWREASPSMNMTWTSIGATNGCLCKSGSREYARESRYCYRDLGPDYFERLDPDGLGRRLTKRFEGLGFKVRLERLPDAA